MRVTGGSSEFLLRVPENVTLAWHRWEDGSGHVVYHPRSGQTHLLDELSAWVVRQLEAQEKSASALRLMLIQEFGTELGEAEVERYLAHLMPRLLQLGLVEESPTCS